MATTLTTTDATYVSKLADPAAVTDYVSALPTGTAYFVIQLNPFDMIQGVA